MAYVGEAQSTYRQKIRIWITILRIAQYSRLEHLSSSCLASHSLCITSTTTFTHPFSFSAKRDGAVKLSRADQNTVTPIQSVYNSQPSALTYLPFSFKCPIELIKSMIFLRRGDYTDAILEEKSKAKPSGLSRVFDNILSSAKRELRKYKTTMNIPTKKLKLDAFGNCHHVQILTTRIHERNELNDIPSLLLHPLPFFAESAAAEV